MAVATRRACISSISVCSWRRCRAAYFDCRQRNRNTGVKITLNMARGHCAAVPSSPLTSLTTDFERELLFCTRFQGLKHEGETFLVSEKKLAVPKRNYFARRYQTARAACSCGFSTRLIQKGHIFPLENCRAHNGSPEHTQRNC